MKTPPKISATGHHGGAVLGHATAVWRALRLNEIGPLVSLMALSLLGYGFFALAD